MKRIAIIGCCGSGKTTLAQKLGQKLDLPVYHMDYYYWQPGWQESNKQEYAAWLAQVVAGDRWIIEGNYSWTHDIRLPAADTIVLLDFPRWICMWGIISRWLKMRGKIRFDIGEGCPEKMDWEFLVWTWNFHRDVHPKNLAHLRQYADTKKIVVLRTRKEVEGFVNLLD